jgi:deoxyribodipyrimidine photo-lyase
MTTDLRTPRVLWLRRDLRLHDHPALLAAGEGGSPVVPVFVLDPRLWQPSGAARRVWLLRSLQSLGDDIAVRGGRLLLRVGDPVDVVPAVVQAVGAESVHVTADTGPYGRRRDRAVGAALAGQGVPLVAAGTPYAVGPGRIVSGGGTPYQVFTPFSRAWRRHGWSAPAATPAGVRWLPDGPAELPGRHETPWPGEPEQDGVQLPPAGEAAARRRWQTFVADGLTGYAATRDRPAVAGTSRLSAPLKFGELHPRTLLADLADADARGLVPARDLEVFTNELCWREFYADVLFHQPDTARSDLRPAYRSMQHDDPATSPVAADRLQAWRDGRTGYPFVDAGMRQLRAEGWLHNRVRMIVASFLVKDLHLQWQLGARHFMHLLVDGDLASNSHGWQWAAGSGTDASPYIRIFNPVTQGLRFDADGDYVRRYVPELRHLAGSSAHEPWLATDGHAHGYPQRIVDHAVERAESLARFEAMSGR